MRIVETEDLKPGMVVLVEGQEVEVIALDHENAYDKYLPWSGRVVENGQKIDFPEARYYGDNEVVR